jgi:hypothetical protein
MRSSHSFLLLSGSLLGLTGVALGAFGAHGLKTIFDATGGLENWKTAVLYQLIHAVALVALSGRAEPAVRRAGALGRDEPAVLVVPQGGGRDAAAPGDLADGQELRHTAELSSSALELW